MKSYISGKEFLKILLALFLKKMANFVRHDFKPHALQKP